MRRGTGPIALAILASTCAMVVGAIISGAPVAVAADTPDPPPAGRHANAQADLLAINPTEVRRAVRETMRERRVRGTAVGIVAGDRLVFGEAFGRLNDEEDPVQLSSLFQIGSITKTFTATLLCALRDEGLLRLDDPVSRFLPNVDLPRDPAGAPEITLRHLATHTSGLPANPVNRRDRPGTPSVMLPYSTDELRAGLADTQLVTPIGAAVRYSNLGFGLLGHALERAAGSDFETLVRERITTRLGMPDTRVNLTAEDERRLADHYWPGAPDTAQPRWTFGEVAGFGGLASNVPDLARYLSFQLNALALERPPVAAATLRELHTPQRVVDPRWKRGIGLAWFVEPTEDHGPLVYHGGELDGHSSFLGFLPDHGVGVIVLANLGGNAADALGKALVRELLSAVRAEQDTVAALLGDGQWEAARPLLQALARRSPLDGRSAFGLGRVLLELARADTDDDADENDTLKEARAAFRVAHRLGFNRPESTFNIARCHARAGESDAALEALRDAYAVGFRDGRQGATSPDFDTLHGDPRFRALIAERFPDTGPLFLEVIDGGAPAALADPRVSGLSEADVNRLGYQLLFRGSVEDAIAIFRYNVDAYPRSWNVYDSLGEAVMNAGRKAEAIVHYEKSMELNPRNTNGLRTLERLRAEVGEAP